VILFAGRFILLALITLAIVWAGILVLLPDPAELVKREAEHFTRAFPNEIPHLETKLSWVSEFPLSSLLPTQLFGRARSTLAGSLAVAWLHGLLIVPMALFIALGLGASFLLGAILRERIRFGHGYASPALAFVAKRALGLSLLYLSIWAFSPIPAPYWTLEVAALIGLVGGGIYAANLPVRL
jgi:hypothetical protein